MSYDIEFTGSLVDNRDVSEVTTSSSMTNSQTLTDARFTFDGYTNSTPVPAIDNGLGGLGTTDFNSFSPATILSAISDYNSGGWGFHYSGAATLNYSLISNSASHEFSIKGPVAYAQNPINKGYNHSMYLTPGDISGKSVTITFSFGVYQAPGQPSGLVLAGYDASGNNLYFAIGPDLGEWNNFPNGTTFSSTFVVPNLGGATTWVGFGTTSQASYSPNFNVFYRNREISVTAVSNISATPSTITQGVQKVGGTFATPTITEEQAGRIEVSSPAKEYGLVAKDGGVIVAEAKTLPPANDSEDSTDVCSDTKIITAQTNTITVEAEGVGAPDIIEAKSKIIIDDVEGQEEL